MCQSLYQMSSAIKANTCQVVDRKCSRKGEPFMQNLEVGKSWAGPRNWEAKKLKLCGWKEQNAMRLERLAKGNPCMPLLERRAKGNPCMPLRAHSILNHWLSGCFLAKILGQSLGTESQEVHLSDQCGCTGQNLSVDLNQSDRRGINRSTRFEISFVENHRDHKVFRCARWRNGKVSRLNKLKYHLLSWKYREEQARQGRFEVIRKFGWTSHTWWHNPAILAIQQSVHLSVTQSHTKQISTRQTAQWVKALAMKVRRFQSLEPTDMLNSVAYIHTSVTPVGKPGGKDRICRKHWSQGAWSGKKCRS